MMSTEQYARSRGMKIAYAVPFELINIAQGHEMVIACEDGTEILVKVPTVDEYIAQVQRYHNEMTAQGTPMHVSVPTPTEVAPVVQLLPERRS